MLASPTSPSPQIKRNHTLPKKCWTVLQLGVGPFSPHKGLYDKKRDASRRAEKLSAEAAQKDPYTYSYFRVVPIITTNPERGDNV